MSHIDTLITDHLDLWTAAVRPKSSAGRGSNSKLELAGIKKLRELILELAVRGKLVAQDPNDEPASVLLERIAAEKARLFNEGKIKKEKQYLVITDTDLPLDKPNGWVFERFGNVVINRDFERIPLAVSEREKRKGSYDYYGASGVIDQVDNYLFDKPLLLIGEDGANLINRSTPIAFMARGRYWVNNHAHVLDGLNEDLLKYICLHINAISLISYITGTAQPKMNQAKMNEIVLGIPPFAEQKRIVAKVDELMALCDQLEQQSEAQLAAHQTLVEVLLATLSDSADADELAQNWARLAGHFDTLFTTDASIDALKQTILQLAVMGKLVPQDPNDEPASVLLARIAAEKARLVQEGKIKKEKPLSEINEDEKPFELPQGWEWCQILELGYDLGGGTPSKAQGKYWGGSIPWVSPKDMKVDLISSSVDYVTDDAISETVLKLIPSNSLLMVVRGMILAHSFPVALTINPVAINQDMKALVFAEINGSFLLTLMKAAKERVVNMVEHSSHGTCKLVSEKLWNMMVCIPPKEEQLRIVKAVDELMALCDQLKYRLQTSQQT
ncbi:restriction endonuclease subunit S, partial [Aquitalea sp. S1-19]|nr:restriction endonuclease subunit S [Aquitalea sp. S1-19]